MKIPFYKVVNLYAAAFMLSIISIATLMFRNSNEIKASTKVTKISLHKESMGKVVSLPPLIVPLNPLNARKG